MEISSESDDELHEVDDVGDVLRITYAMCQDIPLLAK